MSSVYTILKFHDPGIQYERTHLQHIVTAAALNLVRLGEWWVGTPQAQTRSSPFCTPESSPS